MKRFIILFLTFFCIGFCVPSTGYIESKALNAESVLEQIDRHNEQKRKEEEKIEAEKRAKQHEETMEIVKVAVPALIVGVFLFLGIAFYALITKNKNNSSGQNNINIYNNSRE